MIPSATVPERITGDGLVAARIDRLPLRKLQWHLGILVEGTWSVIIFDTNGIGARLYLFVWRPTAGGANG